MEITLDIPEDGRQFMALAGQELIYFTRDGWLYEKTESCNLCGECCMDEPSTIYGNDDEGKCNALVKYGDTWECSAGVNKPWRCLGDPKDVPTCSIRYKKTRIR